VKKTYYVLWQYIANFNSSPWEIRAESPEAAAKQVVSGFRDDFAQKGRVLVFDQPPVHTYEGKVAEQRRKAG
jgi:hypothetical protein